MAKIPEVSRWSNNSLKLSLVFCQNLYLFLLCILLSSNLVLENCFGSMRDVDHEIYLMDISNKILCNDPIASWIVFCTNVTHRKRYGRKFCAEVFSHGMEEHQTELYPRMVKTISLGIPKEPHWTYYTLGLHTSKLYFLSNIIFLHKLGASSYSVSFVFALYHHLH